MHKRESDYRIVSKTLNTMMQRFVHTLRDFDYDGHEEELDMTALVCFDSALMIGIVVTALSVVVQGIFGRIDVFGEDFALMLYWVVLGGVRQLYLRRHTRYVRLAIYLSQIPPLFFSIMMGTFWDPDTATISFLFVIIVLPLLIVDRPIRVIVWICGWTGIYIVCCYLAKDMSVFGPDMIHLSSFFAGSVAMSLYLLAHRLDNISSYNMKRYLVEHDEMSGLKNRHRLKMEMDQYRDKLIFVMNMEVDGYSEIMNFCGILETERLWKEFADTVRRHLPEDRCYKLATGQILVVLEDVQEDYVRQQVKLIQQDLATHTYGVRQEPLTCSTGYVYGDARGDEDIMEMIRHADLKLAGGQAVGTNRIIGDYNDRALK